MGESQEGFYNKTKHVKFSKKRTFITPWYRRNMMKTRLVKAVWAVSQTLKSIHVVFAAKMSVSIKFIADIGIIRFTKMCKDFWQAYRSN